MWKTLFVVIILATLSGCSSPFSKYYVDNTGGRDLLKTPTVVLPTGEPIVHRGNDKERDALKMAEDNFNLVGYSSFNSGNVNESGAIIQAKKIHASDLIIYSNYTGTVSNMMPVSLPNSYAPTYFPYSVHRSDYFVTYWIKMKPPMLGLHLRELPPEIKQKIGSNKGLLIYAVVKNSPAYHSEIIPGDVLKKIEDLEMVDFRIFDKALDVYGGKKVNVVIHRNTESISKEILLGEDPEKSY